MALITILDNEFATLWYHTDMKIIHHYIKKYIYGEKLQELFAKGTEILQKYKAEKWLSDDRNNNALTLQDQAWANNLWFPETAKKGWKYWAIVQPEMITGKLNMNRQANIVTRGGVTVNTFSDPEEALTWLTMQ
jgi:hypothetical protein